MDSSHVNCILQGCLLLVSQLEFASAALGTNGEDLLLLVTLPSLGGLLLFVCLCCTGVRYFTRWMPAKQLPMSYKNPYGDGAHQVPGRGGGGPREEDDEDWKMTIRSGRPRLLSVADARPNVNAVTVPGTTSEIAEDGQRY